MTVGKATDGPPARALEPDVLRLAGVTRSWPGLTRPVLEAVDLTLRPGEIVGVVGRNGAGKTTLLRIAAGLLEAEAGTVAVTGLDPARQRTECQRRLGVVSAGNAGLYGRLGVRAHLELWAALALVPRERRERAIEETLDSFALREFGNRRLDRMSMGQRQRLRLALAFLHEPDLLLLDEPRSSLDAEAWQLAVDALDAVRRRGGAALLCYPSGEADPLAFDRVLEVCDGELSER
jgi:ABC-2 type transport system ATP-binding protein